MKVVEGPTNSTEDTIVVRKPPVIDWAGVPVALYWEHNEAPMDCTAPRAVAGHAARRQLAAIAPIVL